MNSNFAYQEKSFEALLSKTLLFLKPRTLSEYKELPQRLQDSKF